jgi:hypothetical protein
MRIINILGIEDNDQLGISHRKWVEEVLKNSSNVCEAKWSESIAVGNKEFVRETQDKLEIRAKGRKVVENKDAYELRELRSPYGDVFAPEKDILRPKNVYIWNVYLEEYNMIAWSDPQKDWRLP